LDVASANTCVGAADPRVVPSAPRTPKGARLARNLRQDGTRLRLYAYAHRARSGCCGLPRGMSRLTYQDTPERCPRTTAPYGLVRPRFEVRPTLPLPRPSAPPFGCLDSIPVPTVTG